MDSSDLDDRFKYHQPSNEDVKSNHESIGHHCRELAEHLNNLVPEGREKSLAMTHLEEVMMWANAGIARNGS